MLLIWLLAGAKAIHFRLCTLGETIAVDKTLSGAYVKVLVEFFQVSLYLPRELKGEGEGEVGGGHCRTVRERERGAVTLTLNLSLNSLRSSMVLETLPRSAIILPPPIFSLLGTAHGSILYCRKKTRTFLYANRPRP